MDTRKIEDVPFEEVHEIQRYGTYFSELPPLTVKAERACSARS